MGSANPFNFNSSISGSPQTTGADYQQLYNAYTQYLPQVANANNNQLTPTAQTQLGAAQATNAGYQGLANSNTQAGGSSLASLLSGSGAQAAAAGQAVNQANNPGYYSNIASATGLNNTSAGQATNLLNAINLNGLSPGEFNATQRAQNQGNAGTGNLGLNNNTNTINNAMNFGGAFNSKLGLLGNALGSATGVANSITGTANAAAGNAGYSPTGTAATAFQAPTNSQISSNAQTANTSAQNSLLSATSGIQQSYINPQATSAYQNSPGGQATAAFGACCFIFLESYNGILPWWVRKSRDYYYEREPTVAVGYKKMAKWLVPLMRKSVFIKHLVNIFMIKPITLYGGYLHKVKGYSLCQPFVIFKNFWFFVWRKVGK